MTNVLPSRFSSLLDLSRLPWFSVSHEKRLVLHDRGVGPRGMRATHTIPNFLREMDETEIRASLLLPIDFPVLSNNADTALSAAQASSGDRLVSFGSVHPYAMDAEKRLDAQLARGARGIEVHPGVQLTRPNAHRAQRLYEMAGERAMIVFWHCGPAGIEPRLGQYLNQVKHYAPPIAAQPRITFVLGHSGARQFEEALALQRLHPNVWLETSSQSLSNVRRMILHGDPTRIVHGSDWPFYHPAISVSKVLIATEGRPDLRRAVLWENAARLLRLE